MKSEIDAHAAIEKLWQLLPIGLGKDFNTIVNYIEELERKR